MLNFVLKKISMMEFFLLKKSNTEMRLILEKLSHFMLKKIEIFAIDGNSIWKKKRSVLQKENTVIRVFLSK